MKLKWKARHGRHRGGSSDAMQVTVRCPRCGKSLKAAREMIGRRVRCSKCLYEFELSEDVKASPALSTDELPTYGGAEQARDNTPSRSMLPVKPMPAGPA